MLVDAQILAGTRRQSATWSIDQVLTRWQFDAELTASYFAGRDDWRMVYDGAWYTLFLPRG